MTTAGATRDTDGVRRVRPLMSLAPVHEGTTQRKGCEWPETSHQSRRKHLRRTYEGARTCEDEIAGCGGAHQGNDVGVPSLPPSQKQLSSETADGPKSITPSSGVGTITISRQLTSIATLRMMGEAKGLMQWAVRQTSGTALPSVMSCLLLGNALPCASATAACLNMN